LKRSKVLCIRMIAKRPWGCLSNCSDPTHHRFKGMKE
jgi:hypothetical protein